METKLEKLIQQIVRGKRHKLALYVERLEGLSPLRKLSKGYALVVNSRMEVVNKIEKVNLEEEITISVTDGDVTTKVIKVEKKERA